MPVDDLSALASVALAGSLAVERAVTIAKTAFPWLADPKPAAPGESEFVADSTRRRAVIVVTLIASFATAYLIGGGRAIDVGGGGALPWGIYALMISGGSALWTSVVSFASATKDIKVQQKQIGQESVGAGGVSPAAMSASLGTFRAKGQPEFGT